MTSAADHAAIAVDAFERALVSATPLLDVLRGLDAAAAAAAQWTSSAPLIGSSSVSQTLFALVPIIADRLEPAVSRYELAFGFGVANSLLTAPPDELLTTRILHLGELVAQLRAHFCRQELARRGDRLRRLIAVKSAWRSDPPSVRIQ